VDFKDIYNLGVSEDYVPDWKVWEGIRDILSSFVLEEITWLIII